VIKLSSLRTNIIKKIQSIVFFDFPVLVIDKNGGCHRNHGIREKNINNYILMR